MGVTTKVEDVVPAGLQDEINSITVADGTPAYEPQAWTREGQVD